MMRRGGATRALVLIQGLQSLAERERLRRLIRPDWQIVAPIAAVCLCAGAAFAFIELVDDVLEGEMHAIDRTILLAFRTPGDAATPIGPAWVRVFFRDITALGGYPIIVLTALLVAGYLAMVRHWGSVLLLLGSLGGGTILNSYFKIVFDRPRPDFVAHLVEVATASLPSGHATLSAVAYLTFGTLLARTQQNRWLQLYIVSASIGLTLLVGMSRVYLGVHYPTDVLAGWCLGAAWAVGCWLVAWLFSRVPAKVPEATDGAR
jgi:undecaprenyl-diphosphatase